MDMVNISVDFDNLKFRVLALQGQYEVFQILTNTALKELATEFGREDNMISGVKNGMGLSAILHPYILTEDSGTGPSAGYRPQFLPGRENQKSEVIALLVSTYASGTWVALQPQDIRSCR